MSPTLAMEGSFNSVADWRKPKRINTLTLAEVNTGNSVILEWCIHFSGDRYILYWNGAWRSFGYICGMKEYMLARSSFGV